MTEIVSVWPIETRVRLLVCSVKAGVILGWQWRWFTAEYADRKSKYMFPWISHTFTANPF